MPTATPPFEPLIAAEILQDLEAGRSLPLRRAAALPAFTSLPRPTVGGRTFVATYVAANALGRLHPRLARRALLRLWSTPWVHPSTLVPVTDLAGGFSAWSLATAGDGLRGYTGGAGPTAVLVHGWAGRAADWRHLAADLLQNGWRVVVPDLPAHGMTAGRTTDLFELGRALAAVLTHERPTAVVTHSMGFPTTMLALESGAATPSTLVAVAPGRRIAHAVDGFARRARLSPTLADELRRGLEARFGADVWDVLDVDRVLPALDAAGLVLHDIEDDEVSLADAQRIATRWRDAAIVTTAGLGHRRIIRDAQVRATIVDALGRKGAPPTSTSGAHG